MIIKPVDQEKVSKNHQKSRKDIKQPKPHFPILGESLENQLPGRSLVSPSAEAALLPQDVPSPVRCSAGNAGRWKSQANDRDMGASAVGCSSFFAECRGVTFFFSVYMLCLMKIYMYIEEL